MTYLLWCTHLLMAVADTTAVCKCIHWRCHMEEKWLLWESLKSKPCHQNCCWSPELQQHNHMSYLWRDFSKKKKKSSKPTVTLTRPRWRCSEAVPWCTHRTVRVFPGSVQKLHLQFYYNRQDCRVEKHAHTRTLARTVTRALKAAAVLPQGHCMWDCNALFPPHTLSPLHTHTSSITSWDFFHHTVQVFGRRYRTCHIMTQT